MSKVDLKAFDDRVGELLSRELTAAAKRTYFMEILSGEFPEVPGEEEEKDE